MPTKTRRHFSPQEQSKILRLHLLEGRPISELCEEHSIHPTMFYQWQKVFFENGSAAFENKASKGHQSSADQQLIERLQNKLRAKDEVVAEIAAEMVRLKKELGENSL